MARSLHIDDLFGSEKADEFLTKHGIRVPSRRKGGKREKVSLEDRFAGHLQEYGCLKLFARQVYFANKAPQFVKDGKFRLWRFDFAAHAYMLAVETEGLSVQVLMNPNRPKGKQFVVNGGHGTVDGIQEDMLKYNAAAELGWTVLRFSPRMVASRNAIDVTVRMLQQRGWNA